jgi:uncharacterized protein YdhG (YjbR/CyaY superfamily)
VKRPDRATVDAYVAQFPRETQAILKRVRAAIRGALPAAEEAISYGVPVFKLWGTYVVYFAAFKEHYSLYPAGDRLVAGVRGADAYKAGKGTLRFPLTEPVPVKLVERVAKFLAKEAAARARSKATRAKRRG